MSLTKTTRPEIKNALIRKRLLTHLDSARNHRPIIWINAPAGSGKTTLVSSYVSTRGDATVWYQMDSADADLPTFFHYFGQAVKASSRIKKRMPSLTPEYRLGITEFSRNYFRNLFQHIKTPALVVIDNFQEAGEDAVLYEVLADAFEEIPKGVNLIIISRTAPPRPFARLVAGQKIEQLDGASLRFCEQEMLMITQQLYPAHNITEHQLRQLNRHIQGWITGLILWLEQGVPLNEIEFGCETVEQELIFNYFFTEIFKKIEPELQQFLIKTSLLPKMTASLCKQLTGNRAARKILSQLVHKQYFTLRRGRLNPCYEYHPLFREFLRNQACEQLDEKAYRALQNQAGLLLSKAGEVDAASHLLIQTENWPALCDLILKQAKKQLECGRNTQVIRGIEALPAEVIQQQPWLVYWHAMARLQYDNSAARETFIQAYHRFKQTNDSLGLYLSWCGIADAYTLSHDSFAGAEQWLKELAWLQQQHPKPPSIAVHGHLIFSSAQLIFWVQPNHPALPKWMEKMEVIYRFIPNKFLVVMSIVQLSIYYGQRGETQKIRHINRRIAKLVSSNDDKQLLDALLLMTRFANDWMSGDFELDYDFIDESLRQIDAEGVKLFSGLMLSHALYHAAAQHNLPRMKGLLNRYGETVNSNSLLDRGHYQLHLCYYETLCGNFGRAIQHGKTAVELVDQANAPLPKWVSHGMLCHAYIEADQFERAEKHLKQVNQITTAIEMPAATWVYHMIHAYFSFRQENTPQMKKHLSACFSLGREKDMKASAIWPPRMVSTLCGLALENEIEPAYARQLIALYHFSPKESLFVDESWPWPVKIYTLGRFGVLINGQAIDTDSRPFELLKVLLAFGGREVHLDKITDALWPDADGDQARASFKVTLHRLRKILNNKNILLLKSHRLSLNEQQAWVDIWSASRLFERVEKLTSSKNMTQCSWLANKLVQHFRGEFLANESAIWAATQQQKLHQRFIRKITALAKSIEVENSRRAEQCYQRVLEFDPLSELAHQGLIRCYRSQGRHVEAQATHDKWLKTLERNH